MSRSELRNDDQQQPLPEHPTITPASIDKDEPPVVDMPFSPAPSFEDQQQPLPQQPTINVTTINSGESHVATMLTIVPSSSALPLSSISTGASKKRRGRPLGSRNEIQSKKRASGSVRLANAHIMMVNVQEKERKKKFAKDQLLIFLVHICFGIQNVLEKINTFSQNLSENICILSAVGTTSKATICVDGKTKTYEGRFEIISLGGSLLPDKKESHCKVFEGLNVSLSLDGNVFGGRLVKILIAASPVQIVLGSYPVGSQEEVDYDPKEPPKEDPSPPSAESQEKVESDPSPPSTESQEKTESHLKDPSKEDPNPSSEGTLSNSSSDGVNILV
ncbi:DUF296 domain protein [Medicago truncatula]|uniref:AT-hook motif nuclear-localized protein n=1 Tax=Medicago truncatula TaxID=3880 RepID=G7J6G4_MEDTR|nr:DUF296 domain protein [Medicago truncatula]